jgi:hypothetical protein
MDPSTVGMILTGIGITIEGAKAAFNLIKIFYNKHKRGKAVIENSEPNTIEEVKNSAKVLLDDCNCTEEQSAALIVELNLITGVCIRLQEIADKEEKTADINAKTADSLRRTDASLADTADKNTYLTAELKRAIENAKDLFGTPSAQDTAVSAESPFPIAWTDKTHTHVWFGRYPQNAGSKELTRIEWRVLNAKTYTDDGYLFLLSEKILDIQPYYKSGGKINWKESGEKPGGIRKWLKDDFLNGTGRYVKAYFTEADKAEIINTPCEEYGTDFRSGLPDTNDGMFLLNVEEARDTEFFPQGDMSRIARLTGYAREKLLEAYPGNKKNLNKNGDWWWWLRQSGSGASSSAPIVSSHGNIGDAYYNHVNRDGHGVGPCVRVRLKP